MKAFAWLLLVITIGLLPHSACGLAWTTDGLYRARRPCYRAGLFNPDNSSVDLIGLTDDTNYRIAQFLDVEHELLSLYCHVNLMGEIQGTERWHTRLRVKQLYFERDFLTNWNLTAGRLILRWGTGYAFNPTDFVAVDKDIADPENKEKGIDGNDMIKVEYFGETCSIAACLTTCLDPDTGPDQTGLAFRLYRRLYDADVSLAALFKGHETPIWGPNFATVLGDRLEIHGEASFQRGDYGLYHKVLGNEYQLFDERPFEQLRRTSDKYFAQYLVGLRYTLPRDITWVLEYFHRDQGYSVAEWQRLVDYAGYLRASLQGTHAPLAALNLAWNLDVFSARGTMQNYVVTYFGSPANKTVELELALLVNTTDISAVWLPQVSVSPGKRVTLFARGAILSGVRDSEFGAAPQSRSVDAGIRFKP